MNGATRTVTPERGSPAPGTQPAAEPPADMLFRRRVGLFAAVRELWRFRELMLTLAERDLRVRYKQAVLGVGWALLTPLLLMLAFNVIFTRFGNINTEGVPYPLFAAIGLIPWSFFSSAFARGGTSLVNNIPLLNKVYCPREVFPLAAIALAVADASAAGLVLCLLFPIYGYAPQPETIYAPALLLIALFFTTGVTLAVSALIVYLRDLQVLLPMIVQFGLFITPVAYGSGTLVQGEAGRAVFAALNPLAAVIDGLRRSVLQGLPPDLVPTVCGAVSSVVVLSIGFWLFKRMEAGIADIA